MNNSTKSDSSPSPDEIPRATVGASVTKEGSMEQSNEGVSTVAEHPVHKNATDESTIGEDTVARALLSYCCDGPDPVMHALLLGGIQAIVLWSLLAEYGARIVQSNHTSHSLPRTIHHAFIKGMEMKNQCQIKPSVQRLYDALVRWESRKEMLGFDATLGLQSDTVQDWVTAQHSMWVIAPGHPSWPYQLHDLPNTIGWSSPMCLWGQGSTEAMTRCAHPVAIVGSRQIDDYDRHMALQVGRLVSSLGHTVISGGALGADAFAHWGAVQYQESNESFSGSEIEPGSTIAVFAGGLNHIGPSSNQRLFERIKANHGALISELSPDSIPEARRFLLRNRIIAAMSQQIIVTQARTRSGALNTANWGANLLREVYAIPGDIEHPNNAGCNALIRDAKASIVTSMEDIAQICPKPHMSTTVAETESLEASTLHSIESRSSNGIDRGQASLTGSLAKKGTTDKKARSARVVPSHSRRDSSEASDRKLLAETNPMPSTLNEEQRHVLDFIRCHMLESKVATADNLLNQLNSRGRAVRLTPADIARILGSLEIVGLIEQNISGSLRIRDA